MKPRYLNFKEYLIGDIKNNIAFLEQVINLKDNINSLTIEDYTEVHNLVTESKKKLFNLLYDLLKLSINQYSYKELFDNEEDVKMCDDSIIKTIIKSPPTKKYFYEFDLNIFDEIRYYAIKSNIKICEAIDVINKRRVKNLYSGTNNMYLEGINELYEKFNLKKCYTVNSKEFNPSKILELLNNRLYYNTYGNQLKKYYCKFK